jgi:hypothetical protein
MNAPQTLHDRGQSLCLAFAVIAARSADRAKAEGRSQ